MHCFQLHNLPWKYDDHILGFTIDVMIFSVFSKTDFNFLVMFSYFNFQCLNRKQKNQLTTWTIQTVLANDLLTDDSFVVEIISPTCVIKTTAPLM